MEPQLKLLQETVEAKLGEFKTNAAEDLKRMGDDHAKALHELKDAVLKEVSERMAGGVSPETAATLKALENRVGEFESEMARPGFVRRGGSKAVATPGEELITHEAFKAWQAGGFGVANGRKGLTVQMKNGFFPLERKAIITTGDVSSPTVRQMDIDQLGRRELRIRDILTVRPMGPGNTIDYLKQNVFTNSASPQTEGSTKAESTVTYTTATATARTIAHWLQITRQTLDDIPGIREDIDSLGMYGLKVQEEYQIIAGDGAGVHLSGFITNSTAYSSAYNVSGDTKLDKLRHAILQARLALYPVDAIVINPRDAHDIELIKEDVSGANTGRYIVGDPKGGMELLTLWNKPVVESDSITYGSFLTGSFATGATLYDRQQATIDISFENGTNFVENEATILFEERVALAVKRSASFIYGQF